MEEIPTVRHDYTPDEQDRARLKNVIEVIDSLSNSIKSGEIDSKTREIIEGHFFDSMQDCFDECMDCLDLEYLNKNAFITLFEAAFLIGSRINNDNF